MTEEGWGIQRRAGKQARVEAYVMIDRKLFGQKRKDAVSYAKGTWRTEKELRNLIDRLEPLDDVKREAHPRAKISDETAAEMIRERLGTDITLERLAEKYGLSLTSVSRICSGISRTAVYQQVLKERRN